MVNLHLIEEQPHWRVWLAARFAQLVGVCIHVEGFPFGSTRSRKPKDRTELAETSGASIGGYVSNRVYDGIRPISSERAAQLRNRTKPQ